MFCGAQTYSDIITDDEIVSFLSWEIKSTETYSEEPFLSLNRKIYYKISDWDTLNFIKHDTLNDYDLSVVFLYLFKEKNSLDTIFDEEDKKYFFEQFANIKASIWDHKFPNGKITDKKNKKKPDRYYYSLPLFSKNKNYVIIKREYYCGSLCAHGGYFIYRKLDKKTWSLVTVVNGWIS